MAASFKVGQEVKVVSPVPQGLVSALNVSQEGEIQYLISWVNADGEVHERWFAEDDLVEV
jgi:uncharacterized protein YodC (DUF2158 family)